MSDDDVRLMAELHAQATAADDHREIVANLRALSLNLAAKYPSWSADEIETKAKVIWRARRLQWKD
ncbi:hypothetical protein [Neorhizobium galegae]|uniref:Uncharacterized protein n=1 Tax=Neorhizobium galegae bv. officinalis TaxID=323656 RepID=A0A0T7GYE9_NEOGA|nr:hypothetical protein [Neorhizobium galegae]CDZ52321.1 Hypothetical protein NGAL_HAMBI1189_44250 [Neorhizobium galegae bv. officinalis]